MLILRLVSPLTRRVHLDAIPRLNTHRPSHRFSKINSKLPSFRNYSSSVIALEAPLIDNEKQAISKDVTLRPYQKEAIQHCIQAFNEGLNRIAVQLPVGSGKTTIFCSMIPQVLSFFQTMAKYGEKRGTKVLILVDGIDLAEQAEDAAKRILGHGWTIEKEQGVSMASGKADITIATIQTLNDHRRLAKFDPAEIGLIIVDESRHAAAESYLRLLHYFNREVYLPYGIEPFSNAMTSQGVPPKIPIIGFSATLDRHDKLSLETVFQKVAYHRDIDYMLDNGYMSPYVETTVKVSLNVKSWKKRKMNPDSNESESEELSHQLKRLARKFNSYEVKELVVRTWTEQCSTRRSTLVFCVSVQHVKDLTQAFIDAGIDTKYVTGDTKDEERRQLIKAFRGGDFKVLINCNVLVEGSNLPEVNCVIIATPVQSRRRLIQMVGRGLRISPESGKSDCHILYLAEVNRGKDKLDVTPTLSGIILNERKPKGLVNLRLGEPEPLYQKNTDHSAGDFDITYINRGVHNPNQPRYERSPSSAPYETENAWVKCNDEDYILSVMREGHMYIESVNMERDNPQFRVYIYIAPKSDGKCRKAKSRMIGVADKLEDAFKLGDRVAEKVFGDKVMPQLSKNAEWRSKSASLNAIKYCLELHDENNKVGKESEDTLRKRKIENVKGEEKEIGKMKAGEIGDLITLLKYEKNQKDSQILSDLTEIEDESEDQDPERGEYDHALNSVNTATQEEDISPVTNEPRQVTEQPKDRFHGMCPKDKHAILHYEDMEDRYGKYEIWRYI